MEESLESLSMDYLNLLINGEAFSDVVFSVEGRLVRAHRCILAARSLFFRNFFCNGGSSAETAGAHGPLWASAAGAPPPVVSVNSVRYEVFVLLLQFLYSGKAAPPPRQQKHEPRPDCGDRGCRHAHCTSAVDLALGTLAAARAFGVEQLALLTQKQLASMVEKASIEDVMKVLLASRKHQDMQELWSACSRRVARSGLPPALLAEHLPTDIVATIEDLRRHPAAAPAEPEDRRERILRRMRRALDSSDVELVRLMVAGEGLDLDAALALHYAVGNCSRDVVKALLELAAPDVNRAAGPGGRTPLHVAAEMACPDMVAVLLDHHADPGARTSEGATPLDVLRSLASEFLFRGAVPGPTTQHVEPNRLRLCLELVQSAAMVLSREEEAAAAAASNANVASTYASDASSTTNGVFDSRMVYLNLGMAAAAAAASDRGNGEQRKMA